MISRVHLAIATTLLAANVSSVPMSGEIAKRWRIEDDSQKTPVHKEYRERSRAIVREKRNNESHEITWRESTMEELASATGFTRHVSVSNDENNNNYAKKRKENRLSIGDHWQDDIPGTSGLDYPNHSVIPVTSFSCSDKDPGGYYADAETGCQVFHVCNNGGVKSSFLCSPGSVFNQKYLVCDWWYSVDCDKADHLVSSRLVENAKNRSQRPDNGNYEKVSSSPIATKYPQETSKIAKYSKETTIPLDDSTTNDLSHASSAGRTKVSLTKQSIESNDRLQIDFENNQNNVIAHADSNVLRYLESHENRDDRNATPRGFSRYGDDKSLIGQTIDQGSQILTNDLATYINYAYFEARSSKNRYDNQNKHGDSNGIDGGRN